MAGNRTNVSKARPRKNSNDFRLRRKTSIIKIRKTPTGDQITPIIIARKNCMTFPQEGFISRYRASATTATVEIYFVLLIKGVN